MRELLILLVVLAAIGIIWYARRISARADKRRVIDGSRGTALDTAGTDRASAGVPARSGTAASAAPRRAAKGPRLFQGAATSAAGLRYERAADEMEKKTADLANARREAERTAELLADRTAAALAAIQAAAAAHGGAVPGDGTERCPRGYPVKATMAATRYYIPDDPAYMLIVPDVCLESAAAAEAAGFSEFDVEAEADEAWS